MKTLAVVKHVTQYWVFLDIKLFLFHLRRKTFIYFYSGTDLVPNIQLQFF